MEWIITCLLTVVLMIAPLFAANFATPARPSVLSPDGTSVDNLLSTAADVWAAPLILLLLAVATWLFVWRDSKQPLVVSGVPGLASSLAFLGVWALLSAVPNPVRYVSLNALCVLFAALALGGMASRVGRDSSALGALTLAIVVAGSLVAGIGVREYLFNLKGGVADHRTFSTYLNPDFLAGYLLLTLPPTLAAFASTSARVLRLALGLGLALQSACIFLTGSRAGTVLALVAVLFLAITAVVIGVDLNRRRWLITGVAIFVVGAALFAAPTLGRYRHAVDTGKPDHAASAGASGPATSEDSQSHSGAFRKFTWIGATRMALRNPMLGTGVGTFSIAYPKYAETAFTTHAHNSFLQWAGETGLPGALALIASLGSVSAFLLHALLRVRRDRKNGQAQEGLPAVSGLFDRPVLLLCGFTASLLACALHNTFDSDLYIVATLFTFSAVFGLSVAQARELTPSVTAVPRPLGRAWYAVGALIGLFLVVRAAQTGVCRWDRARSEGAADKSEAIAAARSAAAADPFDPEPYLLLSQYLKEPDEAERALLAAARIAPTGMTYYLLGRHYRAVAEQPGRSDRAAMVSSAIAAFERANGLDPHNLQVLRALAETDLEAAAIKKDESLLRQAQYNYQTMVSLEHSPYGTVRAMPELIETDFAYAHAGLAELAMREQQPATALREWSEAHRILKQYWERRNWDTNLNRRPEKRNALFTLYISVLRRESDTLRQQRRVAEADALDTELARVMADMRADEAARNGDGG